jgi:hypothetical protein
MPVGRGVALAWRGLPVATQTGADEVVRGKKPLKILVGRADVNHNLPPWQAAAVILFTTKVLGRRSRKQMQKVDFTTKDAKSTKFRIINF